MEGMDGWLENGDREVIVSRTEILVLVCTPLLAACGGPVKFSGDGGTDAADAVVDVADDVVADDPLVDVSEDVAPDPVEDTVVPDVPAGCIGAGCRIYPDGGHPCCETLVQVSSCPPWDTTCTPDYHCVHCGNGSCDPHEAAWNCRADCPEGCTPGSTLGYACTETETYECACQPPECRVECHVTMGGTRWQNTCTEETYGLCSLTEEAVCLHIGTETEGWYFVGPMGGETLIVVMPCANHWACS
jgi:hypothetical protein